MPTRTTRESDAILVPTTARQGKTAYPADEPFRTQTCRRETALVIPRRGEFITVLRGGGSKQSGYRSVDQPLATFSAQGGHQALISPPETFPLSYYSNGTLQPVDQPVGTLTTRNRYALIGTQETAAQEVPTVEECTFRMLDTREIAAGMAFHPHYQVKGNKTPTDHGLRQRRHPTRRRNHRLRPVEAITGVALPR